MRVAVPQNWSGTKCVRLQERVGMVSGVKLLWKALGKGSCAVWPLKQVKNEHSAPEHVKR